MVVAAQLYRLAMVMLASPYQSGADPRASYTQLGAWLPNHLDMFAVGMALAVIVVERDRTARVVGDYPSDGTAERMVHAETFPISRAVVP